LRCSFRALSLFFCPSTKPRLFLFRYLYTHPAGSGSQED
jgi:hypothetical protein